MEWNCKNSEISILNSNLIFPTMTTLLSSSVQVGYTRLQSFSADTKPPLLTLLSSTSQPGLSPLFTAHVDPEDPNLSFITTTDDSQASSSKRRTFDHHYIGQHDTKGSIVGQVIHIQSPRPTRTYIQAGGFGKGKGREEALPLGIELPWVGIQIKRLGNRGMALEFGIRDPKGIEGVVRLSSYNVRWPLQTVLTIRRRLPAYLIDHHPSFISP
jgi:hypothetical protein